MLLASASTAAVDELRVGDHVETYQQSTSSAPSTADWVRVRFEVRGEATDPVFDVEIIRPESEVLAQGIDGVGAQFQTSLFEYEGVGLAAVLEYERGFKVRVGPGRLVVMTVNHLSNDVYEVGFGDGVAPLRGTGAHSLDRDDWVRVRDLQIGERLQTAEGAISIVSLEKVRGLHRVYNLEVEGGHEYLVGEARVRAHNSCFRSPKKVRFSQDSIDSKFTDGSKLSDLVGRLKADPSYANSVEPIRLVRFNDLPAAVQSKLRSQGVTADAVFSLDNRRLAAARLSNTKIKTRWATPDEIENVATTRRFSTESGGKMPRIR